MTDARVRIRKTVAKETTKGAEGPSTTNDGSGSGSGCDVTAPPNKKTFLFLILLHTRAVSNIVPTFIRYIKALQQNFACF